MNLCLADKIGGVRTLLLAFVLQGVNMVLFATFDSEFTLIIGTAIAAVGYGTLLAVFPTLTAEFYGLKNYGTNYGVLYTAWGIGGAIGAAVVATMPFSLITGCPTYTPSICPLSITT